jgi:hypothetical protein
MIVTAALMWHPEWRESARACSLRGMPESVYDQKATESQNRIGHSEQQPTAESWHLIEPSQWW